MAQLGSEDSTTPETGPSRRFGPLFCIGAGGLLLAMAVETLAVIGRHAGMPLLGSLELMQATILLTASAAMVTATLSGVHAVVHLLTDRLPEAPRQWLLRFADLLSAIFFLGLTVALLWLTIEFWNSHEETELLHIQIRPLRLLSLAAIAAIAVVFLRNAVRPVPPKHGHPPV